jgi:hypothetical protein
MKFAPLIPELSVSNLSHSLMFYQLLGFTIEFERVEDHFAFIAYQGSQLMLEQDSDDNWATATTQYPRGRGVNFEIETDEIEHLVSIAHIHSLPLFREPQTKVYRTTDGASDTVKEFLIQDPDGYLLRFQQVLLD